MGGDAVKRSMGKKRDGTQFFVDCEEAVCLYGRALEAHLAGRTSENPLGPKIGQLAFRALGWMGRWITPCGTPTLGRGSRE